MPLKLEEDFERDKIAIPEVAHGADDLVYDMLGNVPSFEPTSAAAIYSLRRACAAVLMGGVQEIMNLPHSHGMNEISIKSAFMYPPWAPREQQS